MRSPPCRAHPAAPAAWHCSRCDGDLCELCVASLAAGRGELAVCAECGAMVELLTGPRAEVLPFSETWTAGLRPVFSLKAVALIALVSCAVEFLLRAGPGIGLLGRVVELAWALVIIRRAGGGRAPFGVPHWDDLETAFAGAFPRLLVSAGFLAAGAAALELGFGAWPAVLLVAALAVPVLPPALLFASVEGRGARWLAPWNLRGAARSIGRDLWPSLILTALWAALQALRSIQRPLDFGDTQIGDKIFAGAVLHFFAFAMLAALACVTGYLLLTRAEELGHGEPENWRVPFFPASVPAGIRAPPPPGAPAALDDESQVSSAQRLAAEGRDADAAEMLRALLRRSPHTAAAPRAMVILARICAERLGDAIEAQTLYLAVVERFPGTPAARFAQAQLGR